MPLPPGPPASWTQAQIRQAMIFAARHQHKFKPYQMPAPPTGSFDPALTAAQDAAHRGYVDLTQDTGLANTRASEDYGIGLDQTNQDYSTNTGLLQRSFQQLANRQQEGANAAGVLSGGALLQAAAKRAANQGIQQSALDTAHQRTVDSLGLDYQRGLTDRTTALTRAGREDRRFGVDTSAEQGYQAAQSGYVPPGRGEPGGIPKNEFRDAHGHYRIETINGRKAKVRADGTIHWLEPAPRRSGRGRQTGPNTAAGRGQI